VGGFIVLEDGRAYAVSDRAFDLTIEALASEVEDLHVEAWLLGWRTSERGQSLGYVDLRELAPTTKAVVYEAITSASDAAVEQTDDDRWMTGWRESLHVLRRMVESWERGEPPGSLNPYMDGLVPPTDRAEGPGW